MWFMLKEMIKELGIKFNKAYNFLQIIKIVKFICGRGFDFLSSQVFVHNPDFTDALELSRHHLL